MTLKSTGKGFTMIEIVIVIILVGRGSLDNVMERICSVADQFNVKNIFEVLGDNPFVHSSHLLD